MAYSNISFAGKKFADFAGCKFAALLVVVGFFNSFYCIV